MSATSVGIWRSGGKKRPDVPFPVEVKFKDRKSDESDVINVRQARTLIRQLERTIREVRRRRSKRSRK